MTLGFFSHLSPRCRTHCSQEKSGARRGRWESSKCGAFELLRPVLRSHVISKKSPYCFPLVINQPLVCVPARYEGLNFQTIMFAKQNATHFSQNYEIPKTNESRSSVFFSWINAFIRIGWPLFRWSLRINPCPKPPLQEKAYDANLVIFSSCQQNGHRTGPSW